LKIFGLHAARLDLRQDASRLNASLGEILRAPRSGSGFRASPRPRADRPAGALAGEPNPELSDHPGVTAATAETWAMFQ